MRNGRLPTYICVASRQWVALQLSLQYNTRGIRGRAAGPAPGSWGAPLVEGGRSRRRHDGRRIRRHDDHHTHHHGGHRIHHGGHRSLHVGRHSRRPGGRRILHGDRVGRRLQPHPSNPQSVSLNSVLTAKASRPHHHGAARGTRSLPPRSAACPPHCACPSQNVRISLYLSAYPARDSGRLRRQLGSRGDGREVRVVVVGPRAGAAAAAERQVLRHIRCLLLACLLLSSPLFR